MKQKICLALMCACGLWILCLAVASDSNATSFEAIVAQGGVASLAGIVSAKIGGAF